MVRLWSRNPVTNVNERGNGQVIPQHIHRETGPAAEVFGFIMSDPPDCGWAVTTEPATGRMMTMRVVTADGVIWREVPDTERRSYAGTRDAMRALFTLSGLDNTATVEEASHVGTYTVPTDVRSLFGQLGEEPRARAIANALRVWLQTPDNTPEEELAWQVLYDLRHPRPAGSYDVTAEHTDPSPVMLP